MTEDPQFARNLTAILSFTVGVIVCAFAFELVGHGPTEIPTYAARADYYNGMVSNGRDRCPGPLPKGVEVVDVR